MKVLVLADDELKEELLAHPANEEVQWQWLAAPEPGDYGGIDACIDLLFENNPGRVQWLNQLRIPLVVVNSVITPLEEIQPDFIRINGWKTFLSRPVMEAACANETKKKGTEELFSSLGRKTEWVPDIPGFITPRIVACIINEAFLALEEKVSVEGEIDTAMKLGTNYPYGPFEWGQKIGLHAVYSLLEALSKKQKRYTPAGLLKKKILV
jgi:3-hydroxybutyryl-CoA dehydrogenase